mgnify:CR=1 FL=1
MSAQSAAPLAERQPGPDAVTRLEAFTFTGSNIRRVDAETALPVTVIDRDELEARGASTMADLFEDRFGRRFLATLYAITTILMAIVGIAGGNVVALKTLQPLMTKPVSAYTVTEQQMVADYKEFDQLRHERMVHPTTPSAPRYELLKGYYDRGELQPYVSYLNPVVFYIVSSLLVATFVMLGGLKCRII